MYFRRKIESMSTIDGNHAVSCHSRTETTNNLRHDTRQDNHVDPLAVRIVLQSNTIHDMGLVLPIYKFHGSLQIL